MRYGELKRLLKEKGCYFYKDGGRHEIWYSPITKQKFSVGRHNGQEVATGTFNKIKKQSGI